MAIWQYGFFVLPKDAWKEIGSVGIDKEWGFDDEPFWKFIPTKPSVFEVISKILPNGDSWIDNNTVYGNSESNAFEVLEKDGCILSVSFRIDFTTEYEPILNQIIEFLQQNDFIILSSVDLEEIPLNTFSIELVIKNSQNYRIHYNIVEGEHPFQGIDDTGDK